MSKTIYIGGRLESKEKGNVVTGANAILDDTKGKKQNVINKETDDELARLEQSKQDNLNFDNTPTEDSTNPVTSGGVYTAEKALSDAIEAILLLIPSAATALNKLVDTNTMNSSISTATATFRGTYNAVSDLGLTYQATHAQIEAALDALGLTADNNDFAFVQIPVSDQSQDIAKTERFKFNGTNWLYEYDLNTSGFTAAQWAAINSTITLALVQKLAALPTNAELLQALGLKQDVLTFDNAPTTDSNNPVKSGGIKNAIDTAVGDEATDRENADTALSGLIGDEKTRAEGVEGGLDTRLGAVEGSVSTIQGVIPSEATSSNKLVDNLSMTTYIGTIIENIDATFNVTSTDGHVTLAITQVNGAITSVQLTTSDIASAAALNLKASQADLTALAGRVTTAEGNITSLTTRMGTAETDIAILRAMYNALQQSAPQVIEPTDTWPVANPSATVIYRVIDRVNTPPEYYSDYMWNGTAFVLMATYNNAVDTTPQKDSVNLVTSGGVYEAIENAKVKKLTNLADCTISMSYNSDNHQISAVIALSAGVGFIYHEFGYYSALSFSGIFSVLDGINVFYYNSTTREIGLTNSINNLTKTDILLEVFFAYDGTPLYSCWTSGLIAKTNFNQLKLSSRYYCPSKDLIDFKSYRRATSLFSGNMSMSYNSSTHEITMTVSGGYLYDNISYCTMAPRTQTFLLTSGVATIICWNSDDYIFKKYEADVNSPILAEISSKDIILEIFYNYDYDVNFAAIWTSPFITKNGFADVYLDGFNSFSNTKKINDIDEKVISLERSVPPSPYSIKTFRRIGCIGDSYTKGYIHPSGGTVTEDENYAWPHYMEGITNNKYTNFGVSGSTAKGWMNGAAKLSDVQAQGNKCQSYIIGLMINDQDENNPYYAPVGSISDIGTDNNTYYAWYYKLVQAIIAVNPQAPIFCITCPLYENNFAYNQAVRDIVSYCHGNGQKVYLIDLASDIYRTIKYFNNPVFVADKINGHYTAVGYEFMAECLKNIISDVINSNISEFQSVHLIPFDNVS